MKKPVKIGLWLLGFAVLGLLGLWLEHERAKARLAAFKADLIAKGEKLAIADHVPKLPPALSNAAPDFLAAANRLTELKAEWQPARMRMVAPGKARVTWQQPELPTDKEPDLWPFITAHVEDNRLVLAELAVALERPEMVFNLDYSKGFNLLLPHLAKTRRAAHTFANAVLVDLRAGQTNEAFTNLLTSVALVRSFEEPIIISQLVRTASAQYGITVTWEFLQHSIWNERQLRALQSAWQAWDIRRGWLESAGMERAIGSMTFQQCRATPGMLDDLGGSSSGSGARPFLTLLWDDPGEAAQRAKHFGIGFYWVLWRSFEDERWTLDWHQIWIDGARQALTLDAFSPANAKTSAASAPLEDPPVSLILSGMLMPAVAKTHFKFATFETTRRLTITATALHRHRLKHRKFPALLAALVPEFLAEVPRDFMDGQPLRYRLEPDGQFRLWSVGEDFKDDGGDATTVGAHSTNPFDWLKGRDWVWPQPATEAEVAAYHATLEAARAATAKLPQSALPGLPGMVPGLPPPVVPTPPPPPAP